MEIKELDKKIVSGKLKTGRKYFANHISDK